MAYRLALPENWQVHDVFHISLLKPFLPKATDVIYTSVVEMVELDDSDDEEELEIEKLIRWRKVKDGKAWTKEFLVIYRNASVSDMVWMKEADFDHALENWIRTDQPTEVV